MKALASGDTSSGTGEVNLFAVIGAQRTGTNLLREILNTNEEIAMLGEVLSPSPAPAHWDNFRRGLDTRTALPDTRSDTELLLDQYFRFVQYRILNHWDGNRKRHSHAFGVDIKYNQLRELAPANWRSSTPFILGYLRSRGATLIHTTRNVIHSAISNLIAEQRNVWHNYEGVVIDRSYQLDVPECLTRARTIQQRREAFMEGACGCKIVTCRYESLVDDLARGDSRDEIPEAPGPLLDIAKALGSRFRFRYQRRLQKAINIPYSRLLANYSDLVDHLKDSEFSGLVSTLS